MPVKPPLPARCASCRARADRWRRRAGRSRPPACGRRSSAGTGAAAWPAPGASCPIRRSSWTSAWLAWIARRPTTAALAERLEARACPSARTDAGARAGCSGRPRRRRRCAGPAAAPAPGRPAAWRRAAARARKAGRSWKLSAQRHALAGGGLGGPSRLAHEAADVGLAPLERADHPVGVADQRLDRLRLAPEDAQRLAGLAQARVGAPDRGVEIAGGAPPGRRPARRRSGAGGRGRAGAGCC